MGYDNAEGTFLYRVRRDLTAGPLSLDETVYAPGQQLPAHSHAWPILILFLEGFAEHSFGKNTCLMGPGQIAFLPASCVHAFRFSSRIGRAFCVEFRDPVVAKWLPSGPIHGSDPELVSGLIAAYKALAENTAMNVDLLQSNLTESLGRVSAQRQRLRTGK